jgi:hypothetical protein
MSNRYFTDQWNLLNPVNLNLKAHFGKLSTLPTHHALLTNCSHNYLKYMQLIIMLLMYFITRMFHANTNT